ncbi:MAG: GNAT family N-acetyltransferase [Alphaproteobacteria bacterium]|nr:GNAT family N-acetyltransferase [Alphaproteobacteria bacterium]
MHWVVNMLSVAPMGVLEDCCYIAAQSRYDVAENIFSELGSDFALESHLLFTVSGDSKTGILGFLGGHIVKQESCGYIDWLFVDKKWQRQGIGRALIGEYEQYLKSNGIKNEKLMSVSTTNAINFYISGGFKRVLADSYLMQKVL